MTRLWEKIFTFEQFRKKNALSDAPGVYFFLDAKKKILYIGKATSLRSRVQSYFSHDVSDTRGPKIKIMLERMHFVAYQKTDSVLEALILETNLIKQYQPLYNTDAKDDKSFNYVVITNEKYPRVLVIREKEIKNKSVNYKIKYQFGPFTSGNMLREAMKIVRKIFPFRDKCSPIEALTKVGVPPNKRKAVKPCFSAQIKLCPGVCTGAITARSYHRTISHTRMFFEGRKNQLVKKLEREMKIAAKHTEFEKAGEIKKILFALRHIQDVALIKSELGIRNREFLPAFDGENKGLEKKRIEAYDAAHLGGDFSVGVMVAVQGSEPVKEWYKKFILRKKHGGNDLTAMQEILRRRLKHLEWPLPDIIVMDGAELQIGAAEEILFDSKLSIPIIGVAKDARHQPERFIGSQILIKRFQKDILLANSEAHRFAITFHRHRRRKAFLQ